MRTFDQQTRDALRRKRSPLSNVPAKDLALLAICIASLAAIALLRTYLKPLPLHRRVWISVKARVTA